MIGGQIQRSVIIGVLHKHEASNFMGIVDLAMTSRFDFNNGQTNGRVAGKCPYPPFWTRLAAIRVVSQEPVRALTFSGAGN